MIVCENLIKLMSPHYSIWFPNDEIEMIWMEWFLDSQANGADNDDDNPNRKRIYLWRSCYKRSNFIGSSCKIGNNLREIVKNIVGIHDSIRMSFDIQIWSIELIRLFEFACVVRDIIYNYSYYVYQNCNWLFVVGVIWMSKKPITILNHSNNNISLMKKIQLLHIVYRAHKRRNP